MKQVPAFVATAILLLAGCDSHDPLLPAAVHVVGELHTFNAQLAPGLGCSAEARDLRTGRVVAVSQRAVVVADIGNPAGGYTDEKYVAIAADFDTVIWPPVAETFGEPSDIDGNGQVVIFFTRAVNELTPAGQSAYVGGIFASRDLFPRTGSRRLGACPGSNQAEMLYVIAPDPYGEVNGNVRPTEVERQRLQKALAHEMQHLINAGRRLHSGGTVPSNWAEELWLNEGLSHAAEEVVAFHSSSLAPRQNIDYARLTSGESEQDALANLLVPNFQNLGRYLGQSTNHSLMGPDGLATRGATWNFLRYAADRTGGNEVEFWRSLIIPGSTGLANVQSSTGASAMDWIHDWLVSLYVADTVPMVDPRFSQATYNLRDIYPHLPRPGGAPYGHYPLQTHWLATGSTLSLNLHAGSGAFVTFAVDAGTVGEVRTSASAPDCRFVGPLFSFDVGESVFLTLDEAGSICLDGGSAGAEFVYVPFFASASGSYTLTVTGSDVTAPPARPAAVHAHEPSLTAHDWEMEFRRQEARELSRLIPGARGEVVDGPKASQTGPEALRIAVVRTR